MSLFCCLLFSLLSLLILLNVRFPFPLVLLFFSVAGCGYSASLEKSEKNAIIALGLFYFVLDGCFELATQQDDYLRQDRRSDFLFLGLNFAVACVDGIFYSWIFVSLSRTLTDLKAKQQMAKLYLYQRFTWVLVASLVSAVAFAIYQVYYTANDLWRSQWGRIWLIEGGFWTILYTLVLVAVVTLWRPSPHSKDYAFRHQVPPSFLSLCVF